MTSYWRSLVVSESFNVGKYRDLEITVRGHSKSLKVVPFDTLDLVSYQCSIVTLSLSAVFDIFDFKKAVTLKGFVKVIENVTIRYSAYDFLLTFHNNHGPISYRFRDRWRFQSKIAKVSHPLVFFAPIEGVSLGIGYRRRGSKTRMMGYCMGRQRSLTISSAIWIECTNVIDRRTDTGPQQRPPLCIASRGNESDLLPLRKLTATLAV